jgi:hypothetical protein
MTPIGGTRRPSYPAVKDARASSPNLFQSNCYSVECSASDARATFSIWLTARRCSTISAEYIPCSQLPLRLPFGAPPRAPWNRHTLQPRTAGALQGLRVRFEVAVNRGAERKRLTGFMGLPKTFLLLPPPRGQTSASNDGLAAAVHMYVLVLHRDLLPSARAVALEGLHLRRVGATALVQDSRFGISASNPLCFGLWRPRLRH